MSPHLLFVCLEKWNPYDLSIRGVFRSEFTNQRRLGLECLWSAVLKLKSNPGWGGVYRIWWKFTGTNLRLEKVWQTRTHMFRSRQRGKPQFLKTVNHLFHHFYASCFPHTDQNGSSLLSVLTQILVSFWLIQSGFFVCFLLPLFYYYFFIFTSYLETVSPI